MTDRELCKAIKRLWEEYKQPIMRSLIFILIFAIILLALGIESWLIMIWDFLIDK